MIRKRVHLDIGNHTAACGMLAMDLTSDVQAVTCTYCVATMELQPA